MRSVCDDNQRVQLCRHGPASGTAPQVEENLIFATDIGVLNTTGKANFERNIVCAATPDSLGASATFDDNMCGDPGDPFCDNPTDFPFNLNVVPAYR